MCGRYSLTRRQSEIMERFGVSELLCHEDELSPRFNIAPSQMVPVIIDNAGKRALAMFKWGLIPFWAKDLKSTKAIINARSETMAEKPFFRQAVARKRCLIPADGFYEWKKSGKEKTPMYIHMPDRQVFGFAGLWDEWRSPDGEVLRTCTIITTAANNTMSPVHDRMPVVIRREHESLWLDTDIKEFDKLGPALQPLADDDLKMYAVSSRVNSATSDHPDMINPEEKQVTQQLNLLQRD